MLHLSLSIIYMLVTLKTHKHIHDVINMFILLTIFFLIKLLQKLTNILTLDRHEGPGAARPQEQRPGIQFVAKVLSRDESETAAACMCLMNSYLCLCSSLSNHLYIGY